MRILCPSCKYTMKILTSKQISNELRELFADCESPACGARAVMHVSLSHYTRPPESNFQSMLENLLKGLSKEEKQKLLAS